MCDINRILEELFKEIEKLGIKVDKKTLDDINNEWTLESATEDYFSITLNRKCRDCEFSDVFPKNVRCKVKRRDCNNTEAMNCKYFTVRCRK